MDTRHLSGVSLLCALLLTGCTSGPGGSELVVTEQYPGAGRAVGDLASDGTHAVVAWLDGERRAVSLTTWGSSSCPAVPTAIRVVSPTSVRLGIKTYSGACTADLAPYTTEFAVPSGVSRNEPVELSLDVPGRSEPEKVILLVAAG